MAFLQYCTYTDNFYDNISVIVVALFLCIQKKKETTKTNIIDIDSFLSVSAFLLFRRLFIFLEKLPYYHNSLTAIIMFMNQSKIIYTPEMPIISSAILTLLIFSIDRRKERTMIYVLFFSQPNCFQLIQLKCMTNS